ncbi:MAG: hypothetical protein SVX38_01110 [Chloroflexota bacterium]|nr:hypothetical protein [Chloroflexota bacterium]
MCSRFLRIVWLMMLLMTLASACTSPHANSQEVHKNIIYTTYIYTTYQGGHDIIKALNPETLKTSILLEGEVLDPARSPRGDKILYGVSSEEGFLTRWMVNYDGSNPHQVTGVFPYGSVGKLSLDGQMVAFRVVPDKYWPESSSVVVLNLTTDESVELARHAYLCGWSPVDNRIAIMKGGDEGGLHVMRADGSQDKWLRGVRIVGYADWSPNGRQIAFPTDEEFGYVMWISAVDIESGDVTDLTTSSDRYVRWRITNLDWSPDGGHILFVVDYTTTDGFSEENALYVLDVNRGEEKRLAGHIAWASPVWSPDGKEIAFVSKMDDPEGQYGQIYKVSVETGQITQLTNNEEVKYWLSW